MIFLEYIEREQGIPPALFRTHGGQDWTEGEDRIVANLARTMRLAPEPRYMCWWQIPSIRRVDEWEAYFRRDEGKIYLLQSPSAHVLNFTQCGLYDVVLGEGVVPSGLHLVEFLAADDVDASSLRSAFEARARGAASGQLVYVLKRLHLLGPDPGSIALWRFGSYVEAEPFLRQPRPEGPARIVSAGLYRNFGEEIH